MTDEQINSTEQVVDIDTLQQDTRNFNRGTEQGQQLMEKSFSELGAGRSILVDKNGNIIAGNKSQKAAKAAGIKKVRIIETTGDELVAVKRTDIDIDSAEGRKMALLDNLTTQVNLAWDPSEINAVSSEIEGFDPSDYGFDPSQLEVAGIGDDPNAGEDVNPDDYGDEIGWKGGDKSPFTQITFVVANEQADFINRMLSEAKKQDGYGEEYGNTNSNGNAIYLIVKQWAEQKKLS
jgi:hypothetical protein